MVSERLIGFDAREMWSSRDEVWTPERIALYLLRDDAARPLSVDTLVWESLFDEEVKTSGWIGVYAWEDLTRMRAALAAVETPHWTIALTVVGELPGPRVETRPAEIDPAWQRLGYDVAEAGLLSGLSNCGFVGDEMAAYRARFSARLNSHNLFVETTDAKEFRADCERRVIEHAPFFAFGIYRI